MTSYASSLLGSTDRSVSEFSVDKFVRNHLQEVEDDSNEEEIEENPPLFTKGDTSPPKVQPETPLSVSRPRGPPGPGSLTSSRNPEDITTRVPVDPFAAILNPWKCKAHSEVFSAFMEGPEVTIQTMLSSEMQVWL